jgi:hypothetical protein
MLVAQEPDEGLRHRQSTRAHERLSWDWVDDRAASASATLHPW